VALAALNDNGRPDEARRQAANLAVDRDVLGVVGPLHSATAAAAGPALASAGLPWITLASLAPDQLPDGFALEAQPADVAALAEELLQAEGAVDAVITVTAGSIPITQASNPPPAGLIWLGDAAGGARLAGQLPPGAVLVGGPELGSPVFAGRAGAAASGVRWLSAGPDVAALPADFVAAYQELAGAPPSPQAVLAYDATNLLLDAIARAGASGARLDRRAVLDALAALGAAGWHGLSGPVTWQSAGCPAPEPCWLRLEPPLAVHQW
jgi:ABC-type branched-subunit amino acid transport system substrate-binding protein